MDTTWTRWLGAGRRAAIVVDLGFGDAGKGLVTDALTRALGATLVVRFNGGAQAGHNVVAPDGRHHTFAQFGAGSFVAGVRTHLAAPAVVHPTALAVEAAHLARAGVPDALARLSVDARALLVTPVHQAANRLRELARGAARHGSCGAGIGETVAGALEAPGEALRAGDLRDTTRLASALGRLQARKRAELGEVIAATRGVDGAAEEIHVLEDTAVAARWIEAATRVASRIAIVGEGWLAAALADGRATVFEGAQGVLLDEWCGFHPFTTWSTCTFAGALGLLEGARFDGEIARVGVLRSYLVRHGAGPLPTEDLALSTRFSEPHNHDGPWQGRVRRGWPDALLAGYAASVCGGLDAVALTHLDALPRVPAWRVCRRYGLARLDPDLFDATAGGAGVTEAARIRPPVGRDLDRQAALARALTVAEPRYEDVAWHGPLGAERAAAFYEEALGAPVRVRAAGPSAADVRIDGFG